MTKQERREQSLATLRAVGVVEIECDSTRDAESLRNSLLTAINRTGRGEGGQAKSAITRPTADTIVLKVWLEERVDRKVVIEVLEGLIARERMEATHPAARSTK